MFLDRTDQALALAARNDRTLAVLYLDVDRFKRINDSLGHASGDDLLRMLAARLDMEVALRAAITSEELLVHYQPIVGLPNGELRGVEALVRWQRPDIGLVPPMDFIPLAEESGLIGELGRWVLDTAMADAAAWNEAGLIGRDFVLSVNVSAHQLTSGELPELVGGLLAGWTLDPAQLWMEITETAVVSDPRAGREQIRALSALGVRVAIDDFGVGQSSLDQLVHSLPVEILKLDRSFTAHLSDWRERAVVAAIAPMAASLQMVAVAEGVETTGQAEELGRLGYPLAQGFLFGRPVDRDATEQRLRASRVPTADQPPALIHRD